MAKDDVEGGNEARVTNGPARRRFLLEVDVAPPLGQGLGGGVGELGVVEAAVQRVGVHGNHPDDAQDEGEEDEGQRPAQVDVRQETAQKTGDGPTDP